MLVIADDTEDTILVVAGVVVGPTEVLPAVLLLAVFAGAAGEIEADPCFDLVGVADIFRPVCKSSRLG